MDRVVELQPKKHIYELEQCAGCGKTIKEHETIKRFLNKRRG